MKTLFTAFAIATLSVSPALAKPVAPSVSINYSDLNLATESGQKTLDRRITAAARAVCPSLIITGTNIHKPNRCYTDALEAVRRQLAGKGIGAVVASR